MLDLYKYVRGLIGEEDASEDVQWITAHGQHITIEKGQSKEDAAREHFENKTSDSKGTSKDAPAKLPAKNGGAESELGKKIPSIDSVAVAAKLALHPPGSVLSQLVFGKEELVDKTEAVHKVTTKRGKEYTFDAYTYKLSDGRERVVLSAGDPKTLVDAGAVIRKTEGGVIVETIHAGESGFDGLGGVLARFIHRKYGKIKADPDAPLSEHGKRATEKLLKRETKENS